MLVGQVCLVVLLLCVIALVYPYLIYPSILHMLPSGEPRCADRTTDGCDVAVLFCAYNEADSAEGKLLNLESLKRAYPRLEVLAYDDQSSDGSAEIYESRPDLLRVVRGDGRRGKAYGMKQLVGQTSRPFLVFTDANVALDENVPNVVASYFSNNSIGGVCGHLVYHGDDSPTQEVGGRYWAVEEQIKLAESNTGNVMGGDGSIFAVRRSGYPTFADTVQDDFTVTMSVVFNGQRLVYAPELIAYEQLVESSAAEYRRKVRIATRAFHTHLEMAAGRRKMSAFDRWKYFSHKTLRWFGGGFLALGVLAAVGVLFSFLPLWVALAILLSLAALAAALAKWTRVGSLVAEAVRAVMATMQGVVGALAGKTMATWVPANR